MDNQGIEHDDEQITIKSVTEAEKPQEKAEPNLTTQNKSNPSSNNQNTGHNINFESHTRIIGFALGVLFLALSSLLGLGLILFILLILKYHKIKNNPALSGAIWGFLGVPLILILLIFGSCLVLG